MRRPYVAVACLAFAICTRVAFAEDTLKIAVGARGVGETFVAELGQNAGIFRKHGIKLEILYTQGGGETQQVVISDSAQIGVANGFPRHARRLLEGRADPHHRRDLHRRQPALLVRAGELADPQPQGRCGQDCRLFDQRLLDAQRGAGLAQVERRQLQADRDRRRAGDADASHERADQRRLGRRAVRRRPRRSRQDARDRQGLRRSGARPADHPADHRQRDRAQAAPGRVRALHARHRETLDWVYATPEGIKAYAAWASISEARRAARCRSSCRRRPSIPIASPASTTSWPTRSRSNRLQHRFTRRSSAS